jgi:serine/threonine-protein kinase
MHGAEPSTSSAEEGRFPAGTVLAGRYRILGLIGHGGMGEVYRAYDLILNQAVALKFLGRANMSEAALARFRNEVRIARQVSHPNVCRVYDIGFIEGFHFLSMEYLDGEDLASLLRRIGRLPQDKATEFTRKICAGLAAAHERGVLHRDLKPANIMIDGRGQVRITDFGLAALAQEVALGDIRSGTPAYMSPEQKAGKEVSIRSDLYSLGLVLYEMFTGKRRADTQTNPSGLVKDLDPAVERVILRCLEQDPKRRPSSALSVAMALPGGDPIAAALAAGETPSPEMVAASGEKEGFSPRTVVLCFLFIVLAAIPYSMFSSDSRLLRIARLDIPPEALAFHSQEILKQLGYTETPRSTAYGFDCCDAANLRYANQQSDARRDAILATHQPPVLRFWYRQHQDLLLADTTPSLTTGEIAYDSPTNTEPGMVRVALDPKGRLTALDARPVALGAGPVDIDWAPLFASAGLDESRFVAVAPRQLPPMPFDTQMAWTGTYAEGQQEQVHVEAAAWRGRPVYLSVGMGEERPSGSTSRLPVPLFWLFNFLLIFMVVGAILVARHNLRAGRGDRSGAAKIAAVYSIGYICAHFLTAPHVAGTEEIGLFVAVAGLTGVIGGLLWLAYIAVEPYMRRHWPDSLISWNRVLAGRIRDPLVASHTMAGLAAWYVVLTFRSLVSQFLPIPTPQSAQTLNSPAHLLALVVAAPSRMLQEMVEFLLLVVVLRLLARRRLWIADILACILFGLTGPVDFSTPYSFALSGTATVLGVYVVLWLIRRFGFVAMLAAWLPRRVIVAPFVWGSWYTGRELVTQLIPIAVAAWALWVVISVPRRPESESVA